MPTVLYIVFNATYNVAILSNTFIIIDFMLPMRFGFIGRTTVIESLKYIRHPPTNVLVKNLERGKERNAGLEI